MQVIEPKDIIGGNDFDGFGFSFAEYYPYDQSYGPFVNDMDNAAYNGMFLLLFFLLLLLLLVLNLILEPPLLFIQHFYH